MKFEIFINLFYSQQEEKLDFYHTSCNFILAKFLGDAYTVECLQLSMEQRFKLSRYWFGNLTIYMNVVTE